MKFKLEKSTTIKLLVIGAIFLIAPYAVPFSIEFVLMADLLGLEALVVFLLFQSRGALVVLRSKISDWSEHVTATALLLATLYIFQPKIMASHIAGSSVILLFACSAAMALAIWVPAIYFSSGAFG